MGSGFGFRVRVWVKVRVTIKPMVATSVRGRHGGEVGAGLEARGQIEGEEEV